MEERHQPRVVPRDLRLEARDVQRPEVRAQLPEQRPSGPASRDVRVHAERVEHRDGLGQAELAVVHARQQESAQQNDETA